MSEQPPRRVHTVILHGTEQVQVLEVAFWPPVDAEIALPRYGLSTRYVVRKVWLQLADNDLDEDDATIIVEVTERDELEQWREGPDR